MVKPIDTAKIERGTGRGWPVWRADLDRLGAAKSSHGEIVDLIRKQSVSDWWAQTIAVAYEQQTGKRVPGQGSDGRFNVSLSRTIEGEPAAVRALWRALCETPLAVSGKELVGSPTQSDTAKRLYWRCQLAGGSKVALSFEAKARSKTLVGVNHDGLASTVDLDQIRAQWIEHMEQLRTAMTPGRA